MYKKVEKWGQQESPLNVTMQGLKSKKKVYAPIRNNPLNSSRSVKIDDSAQTSQMSKTALLP